MTVAKPAASLAKIFSMLVMVAGPSALQGLLNGVRPLREVCRAMSGQCCAYHQWEPVSTWQGPCNRRASITCRANAPDKFMASSTCRPLLVVGCAGARRPTRAAHKWRPLPAACASLWLVAACLVVAIVAFPYLYCRLLLPHRPLIGLRGFCNTRVRTHQGQTSITCIDSPPAPHCHSKQCCHTHLPCWFGLHPGSQAPQGPRPSG